MAATTIEKTEHTVEPTLEDAVEQVMEKAVQTLEKSTEGKSAFGPTILDGRRSFPVKMLLYGDPGVGKTRFSATAPNPIFLEFDPEGELSIIDSGLPLFVIKSMVELRRAWGWVWKHQKEFDTIVVDSVTNLQRLGVDEIVDPTQLDVEQRDWGRSFRQMRGLIMGLTKIKKNVIFICSERFRDDKIRTLKIAVPNVTPSVASLLNDHCRVIGRMSVRVERVGEVKKLVPVITVYNSGRFWGKDTSGRLPHTLTGSQVNFTWILNQINRKDTKNHEQ